MSSAPRWADLPQVSGPVQLGRQGIQCGPVHGRFRYTGALRRPCDFSEFFDEIRFSL